MSKKCEITGKKVTFGNNVSHSHRKTRRKFKVNLQAKRVYIPELKKWVKLNLSTRAIRTLQKKEWNSSLLKKKP